MSEEEPTTYDPKLNIHQRMSAVMRDVGRIAKTKKSKGMQYDYISHDSVTSAILPQLVAHGINTFMTVDRHEQDGNRTVVDITRTFVNIDNPTDTVSVSGFGYGIDGQDKGAGKGVSYADKILLLKAFMLETGEDVEADQTTNHKPDPKATEGELKEFTGWIEENGMTIKAVEGFFASVKWPKIDKLTGKQINATMKNEGFVAKVMEHAQSGN